MKSKLSTKEILSILPHRYPFLLVDQVVSIDLQEGSIVGRKNVTINEPFFQGHFPSLPIMPGVLIVEALAQTGAVLLHQKGDLDKLAMLATVDHAKFRHPVRPGDVLDLHVTGIHFSVKGGKVHGKAFVEGKVVGEAQIGFVLVEK